MHTHLCSALFNSHQPCSDRAEVRTCVVHDLAPWAAGVHNKYVNLFFCEALSHGSLSATSQPQATRRGRKKLVFIPQPRGACGGSHRTQAIIRTERAL